MGGTDSFLKTLILSFGAWWKHQGTHLMQQLTSCRWPATALSLFSVELFLATCCWLCSCCGHTPWRNSVFCNSEEMNKKWGFKLPLAAPCNQPFWTAWLLVPEKWLCLSFFSSTRTTIGQVHLHLHFLSLPCRAMPHVDVWSTFLLEFKLTCVVVPFA